MTLREVLGMELGGAALTVPGAVSVVTPRKTNGPRCFHLSFVFRKAKILFRFLSVINNKY